ncbi:MAG: DUF1292 domain-containing protein [Lachnospiraceae bacterium]|nr:DUF1292 domain-containing protein [Lachnospiraceae bacterium]
MSKEVKAKLDDEDIFETEEVFPFDENDDDVMVTIELDDGSELDCEILTIFDVGEQDYIVLMPVDENFDSLNDTEVLIYRYNEDPETGEPTLDNIQSDEEYEAVGKRFEEIQEED